MKTPDKLPTNGMDSECRRKVNEIIDHLKAIVPRESATVAVSRTATGTHLRVKGGTGDGDSTPRWG